MKISHDSTSAKAQPAFSHPHQARFTMRGFVGNRIYVNQENWLLRFPEANPNMLQVFRDRDRTPRPKITPWCGEYPGKYLIGAVQCWRLTHAPRLRRHLEAFVADLIAVQDEDGYLGPHPRSERLTGRAYPSEGLGDYLDKWGVWGGALWDVWGHYHCMLGLLLWYEETRDPSVLAACRRAADYVCARFLDTGDRIALAGAEEKNMSVIHTFLLLYRHTGEPRYLQMAREIEQEWEAPGGGDYVRTALAGKEFYETPRPRWESLPDLQAIPELYYITGDEKYRRAAEHIWWSILRTDRHNTGGFSSDEQAVGNPFDRRPIETCCTVAWMAYSVDILRLTGNPVVADELELSTFNATFASQHPSGRWWTYNTPMDGDRRAFVHTHNWQCHPGGPELNCCQANAPRAVGMLSEWAILPTSDGSGCALNYYGEGRLSIRLAGAKGRVDFIQTTAYPRDGKVLIRIGIREPARFTVWLRIPQWSRHTKATVKGQPVISIIPGTYLAVERDWRDGDCILLELDMSLYYWIGEKESEGLTSIYRGPILLAYDERFNAGDARSMPSLSMENLQYCEEEWSAMPAPWMLLKFSVAGVQDVLLCDFASAGACGTRYRTWLPLLGMGGDLTRPETCAWAARHKNQDS